MLPKEIRGGRDATRGGSSEPVVKDTVEEAVDRVMERVEQGEGTQVLAEIMRLLERFPNHCMTNYGMGVYQAFVAKAPERAIEFFEKAIALSPSFTEAYFNLGMVARQTLKITKSVEAFRAAERCSSGDGIAELARTELLWFEKNLLKDGTFQSLDDYLANARLFDRPGIERSANAG